MSKVSQSFRHFAEATARYSGKPGAFLCAAGMIVVWAATGPLFGFGDTWQLVINTGTTIITFMMVFLIQNSQNRDSAALQIKLDELIRATAAHNGLLDVENLDEDALERIRENYRKLGARLGDEAKTASRRHQQAEATQEKEEACEELDEIDQELRDHHEAEAADEPSPAEAGKAEGKPAETPSTTG
ncbi:MAG TPA: low affinity iron permease family protein [Rhodanobacter sp.]|nr:low affinity iron permease family protein [Rhodanobacter sp.]